MDILFSNTRLQKLCCDHRFAVKKLGDDTARRLRTRLDDLAAAPSLEAMRNAPGRCHELEGPRKGQLALDLKHPLRLIFEPADNPAARRADGGLDWNGVRTIRIIEMVDYHGK